MTLFRHLIPTALLTDEHPLEPDSQTQDDLSNWGVPRLTPPAQDYFPNDASISDEDVPPTPREEEHD